MDGNGHPPLTIFLSYRRTDAGGYARAIYDRLAARFGAENVFLDTATLAPGQRWPDVLRERISAGGAFLALIGPTWVESLRAREFDPEPDQVRSEIEIGLRYGDTVIPVLVGDAPMPQERDVPQPLHALLRRNALVLRQDQWDAGVERLLDVLAKIKPRATQPAPAAVADPEAAAPEPSGAPRPDAAHFEEIARLMGLEGSVVPFVGPGANSSDWDDPWSDESPDRLPDAQELARHLSRQLGVSTLPPHLAHIAQQMAVERGTGALYRVLRRTLTHSCTPTSCERFLAQLPGRQRELGMEERFQLIVTSNYDDSLERAFDAAEEPYDLAVYMASGDDKGRFVHVPSEGAPQVVHVANDYREFPIDRWGELSRTVIMKIHGGVDALGGAYEWRNNYVITEDDYIDYLARGTVNSVVPQQLLAKLSDSNFLFLGHAVRDWNLRVFLQRVFGERLPNSSWAIQRDPDRLDDRFWRKVGADLYALPLRDYVDALMQAIATSQASVG
jgi:hypothetical protein